METVLKVSDTHEGLWLRVLPRGTLCKKSSYVCTSDFMGVIHTRKQDVYPAKYRLSFWEQDPGAK